MSLRTEAERIYRDMVNRGIPLDFGGIDDRPPSAVTIFESMQERDIGTPCGWAERVKRNADPKLWEKVSQIKARRYPYSEARAEVFSLDRKRDDEY